MAEPLIAEILPSVVPSNVGKAPLSIPITVAVSLSSTKYNGDCTPKDADLAEIFISSLLTTIGSMPWYFTPFEPAKAELLYAVMLPRESCSQPPSTNTALHAELAKFADLEFNAELAKLADSTKPACVALSA